MVSADFLIITLSVSWLDFWFITLIGFWFLRCCCGWLSFEGFFTESIECPAPQLLFVAGKVVPLLIGFDVSTILVPHP